MIKVSAEVLAALEKREVEFTRLIKGAGLAHTDYHQSITWQGTTYINTGVVLAGGSFTRSKHINTGDMALRVTNADQEFMANIQAGGVDGREVNVYTAILQKGSVVAVINMYKGLVDAWQVTDASDASDLQLELTSPWGHFDLSLVRHASDGEHQNRYPGDNFFDGLQANAPEIDWGV